MFEKEISNYDWNVSEKLEINKVRLKDIPNLEAEAHIMIMKCGMSDIKNPEILIDCSYPKYITQFSKSQFFTLTEILISTINTDPKLGGYILGISGSMPLNGISIRKKKYVVSEEEKIRRIERGKYVGDLKKKDRKLK